MRKALPTPLGWASSIAATSGASCPGVLSGFAGSLFEIPSFVTVGMKTPVPWWHSLLGMLATVTCFCALGIMLGLVFEAVFHLLLGTEPPPVLANRSAETMRKRRGAAAHLLAGIVCVLAAAQFPNAAVLVVVAIVPLAFVHVALSAR